MAQINWLARVKLIKNGDQHSELSQALILEGIQIPDDFNPLIEQPIPPGKIPVTEDFPGRYNFLMNINEDTSGQHWVYSRKLQQIFIGMNKKIVMQFTMSPDTWQFGVGFYIVALPVYSTDEHINVPVNRCTFHSVEDDPQGQAHQQEDICLCGSNNNFVGHVVRCGSDAEYFFNCSTKRHGVRVRVTPPEVGSECIRVPYFFSCKTSCPKGMQRRPIQVIFTLEDETGVIHGRQKIGVKICSCPKRDKKRQEDCERDSGNTESKRKRPAAAMEEPPQPAPRDMSFNQFANIKVEPHTQRYEVAEIKQEMSEMRKMFETVTEILTNIENKYNRISELINTLT